MSKTNIAKYAYFTIVMLLPLALVFFPVGAASPFKLFLMIPWMLYEPTMENYRIAILICCIFFMSTSFFIATLLHKTYKEKPGSQYTFFLLVLFFFLVSLSFGENMRIILYSIGGILTFCPLYFYGILYYHRFINKEQKVEDDNISK